MLWNYTLSCKFLIFVLKFKIVQKEMEEFYSLHTIPKPRNLYYIAHMDNLPSILKWGILSHNMLMKRGVKYTSISDEAIVLKRKDKETPEGKSLWDYANLYFQPRNAMLYRVFRAEGKDVIIIGLNAKDIFKIPGVWITDGNAASYASQFLKVYEENIQKIREEVNKPGWYKDEEANAESKRKMMAECLIPDEVPPNFITEIYTPTEEGRDKVKSICAPLRIPTIYEPRLFFLNYQVISYDFVGSPHKVLHIIYGDILLSSMQTITIGVNTAGVLIDRFVRRVLFRLDCAEEYLDLCESLILKPGKPFLHKPFHKFSTFNNPWVLLFPITNSPQNPLEKETLEEGLKWVVENYQQEGINSLAVPALGCGQDGFRWLEDVQPLLLSYLSKLDIPVEIYKPYDV